MTDPTAGRRPTSRPRSWREMQRWMADELLARTGEDVASWNAKIRDAGLDDEAAMRRWLAERGVTGYPAMLLRYERFGYPDYLTASADELVEGQYRDRPGLRPIYDAILARLPDVGDVTVQTRKTYVSLLTPRRTFAAVQPTTRTRVDLGLRLEGVSATDRLIAAPKFGQSAVTMKVGLTEPADVDDEVEAWLREAYRQSA